MTAKIDKVDVYTKGQRATIYWVFWCFDHVTKLSHDRCKTLYLNFRGTYGYQTWQSGGFQYGPIIYQVT